MPMYSYTTSSGTTVERHFPMGEAPKRVRVKGEYARKDLVADHVGRVVGRSGWPMWSMAMGVQPNQAAEAEAEAARLGVPTTFSRETGDCRFDNRAHRKKYLKATGYYDRNAGYGDPTPENL